MTELDSKQAKLDQETITQLSKGQPQPHTDLTSRDQQGRGGMTNHGITYYGTDGNGEWMERCPFRWDRELMGVLQRYKSQEYNEGHSIEYRNGTQLSYIEEELPPEPPLFLLEWWVSFEPDRANRELEASTPDSTDFETRVHYDPNDKFLEGVLTAIQSRSDQWEAFKAAEKPPKLALAPDLHVPRSDSPLASLRNQFIVETVLPFQFSPASSYADTTELWDRASDQALSVPRELQRVLRQGEQG